MIIKSLKKSTTRKKLLIVAGVFVVLISIFLILETTGVTHIFSSVNNQINGKNNEDAKTTSKEPSAQSDFTNGGKREVTQTNKNEGIVTDTKGNIPTTPPKVEWLSSADGVISVYSPTKNSILASGQSITGESTSKTISFRLIDNVSGVIAQGTISGVNGKFSGIFDFQTSATEGRLDVFISNSNGVESSNVEIPVRFSQ